MAADPTRLVPADGARRVASLWVLLGLVLLASSARAGAWLQPEGEWIVLVPATYETADAVRDADGRVVDAPDFSKFQIKPFAEYGLRRWLTLGFSPDWQRMRQGGFSSGAESASGLASVELHARAAVRRWRDTVFSAQATVIVPAGFDTVSPYFSSNSSPSTDRFGGEFRLLVGHGGLGPDGASFVEAQVALRSAGSPVQDELRYDFTAGWGDPRDWLALAQFFGIEGIGGARSPATDFDLLKVRVGATRGVRPDLSVQFAFERAVGGHDTIAGGAVVVALWWWP